MSETERPFTILIADDDEDDRLLARDALAEIHCPGEVRFVEDGEKLLDYLRMRGEFAAPGLAPRPTLILMDLNMPKKGGLEAAREIKGDPLLRDIPIVVFTTSKAEEDIARTKALGLRGFITKPVLFSSLVETMRELVRSCHSAHLPG